LLFDRLQDVTCPILLVHAQDDPVIPFSHSKTLSDLLLQPLLYSGKGESELVQEERIGRWGTVKSFERGEGKGRVTWAEVSEPPRFAVRDRAGKQVLTFLLPDFSLQAKEGSHTFIGETEFIMRLSKSRRLNECFLGSIGEILMGFPFPIL
jgi:abhydrolase domain-containing protein 12